MLTIEETLCKRDGICASVCPIQIISLNDGNELPHIEQDKEEWCLSCGHCVSACPHGALQHVAVNLDKSPLIRKELTIDLNQTTQFLRSRRSIRNFSNTPIEKDKIQSLIEIARYAPTGSNRQLLEWRVLTGANQVREIVEMTVSWMKRLLEKGNHEDVFPYIVPVIEAWDNGYDMILRNSQALIVAAAPHDVDFGMVDVLLALSYLELAAPKFDLGGCWAGLLHHSMRHHKPLRERLGLSDRLSNYFPMMLGYPRYRYYRLLERKSPKIKWM
jgi:nitroreductase/NAD-dependent dihydropyrimidine dehydrogenase PreA subunit